MTDDPPTDRKIDSGPEEDFHTVLKSHVESLKSTVNDLDTALERTDLEEKLYSSSTSDRHSRDADFSRQINSSDLPAIDGLVKIVITEFEMAISLLEEDQTGLNEDTKILLTHDIASQLSDKFPMNSYFQKLQGSGDIEVKQTSSPDIQLSELYISGDRVYYPITFASFKTYLELSSPEILQPMSEEFDTCFSDADELDLAVPPWRELLEGLAEATSKETAQEFETLVEAATPDDLDSLDEVSLALIAAARTGALQYDISKWGEEMNIASKETFSRRKSSLVDDGVVTTEPVQVEMGRPRERLLLVDDSSEDADDVSQPSSEPTVDSGTDENIDVETPTVEGTEGEKNSESNGLDDVVDEMLKDILLTDDS